MPNNTDTTSLLYFERYEAILDEESVIEFPLCCILNITPWI